MRIDPANPPFAELRQLLRAAYDVRSLRRLADHSPFQGLRARFPDPGSLDDLIDQVLEFCRTQSYWEELLDAVARDAPQTYRRFAGQMDWSPGDGTGAPRPRPATSPSPAGRAANRQQWEGVRDAVSEFARAFGRCTAWSGRALAQGRTLNDEEAEEIRRAWEFGSLAFARLQVRVRDADRPAPPSWESLFTRLEQAVSDLDESLGQDARRAIPERVRRVEQLCNRLEAAVRLQLADLP